MPTSSKRFGIRRAGMNRQRAAGISSSGETLSGWEGIEDHLMTNDTGEMEDYADDIDTLLVFAGLFSAILTAFLVQTYPMLQADGTDTTNQLLALSVSTQLRTAGTIISNTLNQTLSTLADAVSTSFSPSTATRWINILFFLSLVSSLAAALFSILAKQWIREYIKWNSPLALPRENVLVRQIRIEAWEDWQVSTVLSSIPILLELGMILFLAGVILLLWTLDDVVAITITIFVSLFLGAFAAFTVIPILSTRCPYRSPTAWACYIAFHFLVSSIQYFIHLMGDYGPYLQYAWRRYSDMSLLRRIHIFVTSDLWRPPQASWPDRLQTWRDCDLQSCKVTKIRTGTWWPKTTDLHDAAGVELVRESADLGENGMRPEDFEPADGEAAHLLLRNLAEVSYLVRALAWVLQSSQSTQVVAYIDLCVHQLHCDTSREPFWLTSIHMVTIWCVILSLVNGHARSPHLALLHGSSNDQTNITQLRRKSGENTYFPILDIPSHFAHLLPLIMRLLAQPVMQLTADPSSVSPQSLRRCREFLGALRRTASGIFIGGVDRTWYVDTWETMRHVFKLHNGAIILMTFEQLLEYGKATVGEDQTLSFSQGTMEREDYGSLLLHYSDNLDNASDEDLNIFVITSFRYLESRYPPSPIVPSILGKMISVAEIISHRQRRDTHRVEGAEDAAWLGGLYSARGEFSGEGCVKLFRRLLHIFERSYAHGVLVGDQDNIRWRLHGCLETAHRAQTCEVADCPWVSHSCGFPWWSGECTLLPIMTIAAAPDPGRGNISEAPAPDAAHATSLSPTGPVHELSITRLLAEHHAPCLSSAMQISADSSVDSPSAGRPTDSSFYGHSPAILVDGQLSDPEAIGGRSDGSSALPLASPLVGATSGGDTAGGIVQAYTALLGTTDMPEPRESVAQEDPTRGPLRAESLKDRDAEQTAAQDPEDHCAPSQGRIVASSTDSASVRSSTVGAPGPSDADAIPPGTDAVTNRPAQCDMPQDSPPRPVVAAEGSPQGESATGSARIEEEGPMLAAAVLFQGEAGVSESGGEMFELTRWDEGAGEGGPEGVGDGLVEVGS